MKQAHRRVWTNILLCACFLPSSEKEIRYGSAPHSHHEKSCVAAPDQLNGFLAGKMLHGHFQQAQGPPLGINDPAAVFSCIIGGIFLSQFFNGGPFPGIFLQNVYPAKGDGAAEPGGIGFRLDVVLFDDAEGSLFTAPVGIQFVSRFCTMEINPSIIPHIAERNPVGISFIPQQSQNTAAAPLQDLHDFFLGEGLLFSSHFPKHH